MERPCVRVPREEGEETRRELAAADLVAEDADIVAEDGWVYVPVVDPGRVPAGYEVVTREVPARETQTLPEDLLDFEPTYERLGEVVIVDEDDPDRARRAAEAIMESSIPAKTVVNRASKVKGQERVRDWEVLAGDGTETVHREYGYEFLLDVQEVYFSPRLATERHRVVEAVDPDDRSFDMFAGVGPYTVPLADRGREAVGVDINPRAVAYLRENARRNDVADALTAVEGDVREVASDYRDWADRIVMNLPHSADEFLDTAVEIAGDDCMIHYYDIQPDDDPFGPGTAAIREAASDYAVSVADERIVRSYAPHEVNVCIEARLTR